MQRLCSTGPGRSSAKHCHHSIQHYPGFRFVCYAAMTANFHQDQSGAVLCSDSKWYGGASQRQGPGALLLWRMVCPPLPPSAPRLSPAQLSSNLPKIYFPCCWAWSHLSIAQCIASAADYIHSFPSPPILVSQPVIGLCWGRFDAAHQFPA